MLHPNEECRVYSEISNNPQSSTNLSRQKTRRGTTRVLIAAARFRTLYLLATEEINITLAYSSGGLPQPTRTTRLTATGIQQPNACLRHVA